MAQPADLHPSTVEIARPSRARAWLRAAEAGALPGITRGIIIRLAGQENIRVVEKNLTRFDLYVADEFFLTGTGAEIIGIVEIDKRIIGEGSPGPVTNLLRKKFFEYAHGKEKD